LFFLRVLRVLCGERGGLKVLNENKDGRESAVVAQPDCISGREGFTINEEKEIES
jgi:hypothetical protein